ncbi:hypothetical protein BC938DRAFT_476009, partial [Jimgerdemannia flammicorona]
MPFIIQGINSEVGYDPNVDPYAVSKNSASTARDTGDRFLTRRFPMLMGMLGMILSTILVLSNYYWLLLIARFAQGVSATCVWTLGLSLIADIIRALELGVEMGKIMVSYSVGLLAGPPIGGGPKAPFIFSTILADDFIFRLLVVEKRNTPKEWFDNDDVEKVATPSVTGISEKINVPTEKNSILGTVSDTAIGTDNANENKIETTSAASGTLARQEVQTLKLIINPRMIFALVPTVTLRLATEGGGFKTGSIGLVFIAHVILRTQDRRSDYHDIDRHMHHLLALPNKDTGLWSLIVGLVLVGGVSTAFLSPALAEIAAVVNMQG